MEYRTAAGANCKVPVAKAFPANTRNKADSPPRTIEEFDVAIDRLTILDPDGNVERAGFLPTDPGWWSWCWGGFFGGHLYDEKTGLATVDSPQNIAGYDWYQSFPKRWGLDKLRRFQGAPIDNPSPYRNFFSGRLATTIQGPWLPMFMDQELGPGNFDYGACPFPVPAALADQPPYGPIEADILVVPAGAKNPDASMEFIAFTQRTDNMETLCVGCLLSTSDASHASRRASTRSPQNHT